MPRIKESLDTGWYMSLQSWVTTADKSNRPATATAPHFAYSAAQTKLASDSTSPSPR